VIDVPVKQRYRKDIPVIVRCGSKLKHGNGNAFLYNKTGDLTWRYEGKKHNGIGITGCTRSGTQYMTRVLHKLGLNVGHENMAPDGSVGYHLAIIRPKNCLHQVRHPLKQIASNITHNSWGFIDQVLDLPDKKLLGCMQYWLMWNQMCEDFCVWRYQIERLPDVWDEFLGRIGHNSCPLPEVPTNTNKSKNLIHRLTWADLFNKDRQLAEEIRDMAVRYGYSPEADKEESMNLGERETAQVASV
jgi:hypothetical protein